MVEVGEERDKGEDEEERRRGGEPHRLASLHLTGHLTGQSMAAGDPPNTLTHPPSEEMSR